MVRHWAITAGRRRTCAFHRRLTELIACGPVEPNPSEAPLTAWTLGLELASITGYRGDVIIQTRNAANAPLLPVVPRRPRYLLVAQVGKVSIFMHCTHRFGA